MRHTAVRTGQGRAFYGRRQADKLGAGVAYLGILFNLAEAY